jgi:flagellar protein FlaJ
VIRRKAKELKTIQKKGPTITDKYKTFCYHILGKRLTKNQRFERITESLKMANVKYTPGVYLSVIIITGLLVTLLSFLMFTILFYILLRTPTWPYFVLILSGMTGGISFAFLPMVIRSRISSRKTQIDHELPFTLSELSILASTGLTPIDRKSTRLNSSPDV